MPIRKPIFVRPLDLGTITTGNETAGFPAANLNRHKALGLTWKTTGASNVWVRGNLGAARSIDFCSIISANALAATNIRLRLGDTQNDVDGISLLAQPNSFDTGSWTKVNATVTADNVLAPDGTMTGDTLTSTLTGGSATCVAAQQRTVAEGQDYTFSVYMKQGTSPRSTIRMTPVGGTQSLATVTWSTEPSMVATGADLISSGFESVGGGWYRVWLTRNSGTAAQINCGAFVRDTGNTNVSGETVAVWGAELRLGSEPTYDSLVRPFISPSIVREDGLYHSHLELPAAQNKQWFRIDITGHTGDFQASNLILGRRIEPSGFYNFEWELGVEDLGNLEVGRWGVLDEVDGAIFRTINFTLGWQTEAEFEEHFRPMMERLGRRGIIYLCFDPEATPYRQAKTYMGLFQKPPYARSHRKPQTYSQDFEILSFI